MRPIDRDGIAAHSSIQRRPRARFAGVLLSVCLLSLLVVPRLAADSSTHFWITTSHVASTGAPLNQSQVPVTGSVIGSTRYLYIWAQPATGKTLQNFSLDLVTDPSYVEFPRDEFTHAATAGSILVNNPLVGAKTRFEYVRDSLSYNSSGPVIVDGAPEFLPYRIRDMKGFTIFGGNQGIGGATCGSDPNCTMTANGPAWLIASVTANVINEGLAEFYLQVGSQGMNYAFEPTSHTNVVFGASDGPVYNAYANLEETLPGDTTADFILQVAGQSTPLSSGAGGNWAQLDGGSAPSGLHDVTLTGGTVTVAGQQLANLTNVNAGLLHIGAGSSLASNITVNPGGSLSGNGWIDANLTLAGKLSLSSGSPLMVFGAANIAGGSLDIVPGSSLPVGQEFAALTAVSSLSGTLNAVAGQSLGANLTLQSIRYTSQSVFVTLALAGLPGDFNNDNKVDAADYAVWRKTDGTPSGYNAWRTNFAPSSATLAGDFNSDGKVDAGDYVLWRKTSGSPAGYNDWRNNFGRVGGSGDAVGVLNGSTSVPEPPSAAVVLVGGVVVLGKFRRERTARFVPQCTHNRSARHRWAACRETIAVFGGRTS